MIEEKDILKYLEGSASKRTRDKVDLLIGESPENKEVFEVTKLLWNESALAKDYVLFDTNKEWDVFQKSLSSSIQVDLPTISRIHVEKKEEDLIVQKDTKANDKEAKVIALSESKNWRNILSIAASVAVLVTATWFLWPESEFIDIVNAENDTELMLDDGSTVRIKKGASLKTLRSYKYASERNAEIAGEVNFDIASDPDKPFIVQTEETAVRVLGTKFNVIATGIESEVANEEGRVRFFVLEDESQFVNLNKGDRIKYDGNGFIDLNEPEPEPEPEPIPLVEEIMDYLRRVANGKVTFGSGIDAHKLSEIDIDYQDKTPSEIIKLLEGKAIVIYTSSCTGCYHINEIIPRR